MSKSSDSDAARLGEAIVGALDWWRDAGVDFDFVDAPQDWLADHATAPTRQQVGKSRRTPESGETVATIPRAGGDRNGWPPDLAAFQDWWLKEPSLAPAGLCRVPPAGPAGAALMVLVSMPEAEDSVTLLSGRGGKLIDAMLAAMGLRRDQTYLASILPARIVAPDWSDWKARQLGDVVKHHVALAQPQRILILGRSIISALSDNDSPHNLSNLPVFNHEGVSTPAIATYELEALLARPALKANLWNRWLDWTGNELA